MKCICRTCKKVYDEHKARGEWKGFCSAKCQHFLAKSLGYSPKKHKGEYEVLCAADCIGSIPTEEEREGLRAELAELEEYYGELGPAPFRMKELRKMLSIRSDYLP